MSDHSSPETAAIRDFLSEFRPHRSFDLRQDVTLPFMAWALREAYRESVVVPSGFVLDVATALEGETDIDDWKALNHTEVGESFGPANHAIRYAMARLNPQSGSTRWMALQDFLMSICGDDMKRSVAMADKWLELLQLASLDHADQGSEAA